MDTCSQKHVAGTSFTQRSKVHSYLSPSHPSQSHSRCSSTTILDLLIPRLTSSSLSLFLLPLLLPENPNLLLQSRLFTIKFLSLPYQSSHLLASFSVEKGFPGAHALLYHVEGLELLVGGGALGNGRDGV
jgi:hypothetical protein